MLKEVETSLAIQVCRSKQLPVAPLSPKGYGVQRSRSVFGATRR